MGSQENTARSPAQVEPGAVLADAAGACSDSGRVRGKFAEHEPFELVVVEFAKAHHPFASPISL